MLIQINYFLETDEETELEESFNPNLEIMLELEECDNPFPPIYEFKHIPDNSKWMMLNDLLNLLNMKSKDKLLKHVNYQLTSIICLNLYTYFAVVSSDSFINHSKRFNN